MAEGQAFLAGMDSTEKPTPLDSDVPGGSISRGASSVDNGRQQSTEATQNANDTTQVFSAGGAVGVLHHDPNAAEKDHGFEKDVHPEIALGPGIEETITHDSLSDDEDGDVSPVKTKKDLEEEPALAERRPSKSKRELTEDEPLWPHN